MTVTRKSQRKHQKLDRENAGTCYPAFFRKQGWYLFFHRRRTSHEDLEVCRMCSKVGVSKERGQRCQDTK